MNVIDQIIEHLQHPLFMLIGGVTFWFTLLWSINRNKNGKKHFWKDQKDEIIVTIMGGLLFLVFTKTVLSAWDWIWQNEIETEFQTFFFLLVGPAVERIYKFWNK